MKWWLEIFPLKIFTSCLYRQGTNIPINQGVPQTCPSLKNACSVNMLLSITNRVQACLGHLKYCTAFSMLWRGTVVCYLKKNLSFIFSWHFRQCFGAWERLLLMIAVHKVHSWSPFFCKEHYFPPPISSRLFSFLGSSGAIYMPFGSCKKFSSQLSNWMEVTFSPAQTDGLV